MPIWRLGPDPDLFPSPSEADDSGLLAVGGDLSPRRLLAAYASGIFPWYSEGQPILWHSPDPRFALRPSEVHLPKSLKKLLRKNPFEVRFDHSFMQVIDACAEVPRPNQSGTWITSAMRKAYLSLHELGFAHSVESWQDGQLVGGLYGVSLGAAFFGESMFARADDASKVAFATLCERLVDWEFLLIDCQVETENLARFGATEWPREEFLAALDEALQHPTKRGKWG